MDRNEAFEVFEIKNSASKDEIIKRYSVLLKKYKNSNNDSLNKINEAYNILMEYNFTDPYADALKEKRLRNPNKLYKKFNIDEEKADNFLYYNKFKILIIIAALILAVFAIKSFRINPAPDLNIVFLGNILSEDQEKLEKEILIEMPEFKNISLVFIPLSSDSSTPTDAAMQMKVMAEMAAGVADVFILDKNQFQSYAALGAFAELDGLASKLDIDMEENNEYILKIKNTEDEIQDNKEHLYGISIKNSRLTKENIISDDLIYSIRPMSKNLENAEKFLEQLLKSN